MPRGGQRKGAGRKAQGVTKKVSLTLTPEEWEQIEQSGQPTVAAYLKCLMAKEEKQTITEKGNLNQDNHNHHRHNINNQEWQSGMTRHEVNEYWNMYLNQNKNGQDEEVLQSAYVSLINGLFPGNSETVMIETKPQYLCPFSGKRYGSMQKLVRAAIPLIIGMSEKRTKSKKQLSDKQEAIEEAERHREKLIKEGKLVPFRKK